MQLCHDADRLPVELLRIGRSQVIGAKARFHMSHRDLQIKAGQTGGKGRGRIAVDQHQIRFLFLENSPHPLQHIAGDVEEGLLLLHNGQVIVRNHMKALQHLIQHLPVLTGNAYQRFHGTSAFQFFDQRAHFDSLRSGAKHQHYFFHKNQLLYPPFDSEIGPFRKRFDRIGSLSAGFLV